MAKKERIVGILVVGCLLVLAFPALFDQELPGAMPEFTQEISVPPEFKPFREVKVSENLEQLKATSERIEQRREDFFAAGDKPKPSADDEDKSKNAAASSVVEPTSSVTVPSEAWLIQVSSFRTQSNAVNLKDELRAKKFRAFVKSFKRDGEAFYRVYVGPESRWKVVQKQKDDLLKKFRLDGIIVKYDPLVL